MAQELRSINLTAPAFKGINTEDSPVAKDPSFADIADNAVIDKRGRVAARKGYTVYTQTNSIDVEVVKEFQDQSGNKLVFSAGENKIVSSDPDETPTAYATMTDRTPAAYTITDNDWKAVNFNDKIYFFQRGYEPLVGDGTLKGNTNKLQLISAVSGSGGTANVHGHEALSAYGRLWVADFDGERKSIIYWSDLLIGQNFTSGSSGSIDISKVWPDGQDEIVALAAHNGLLIIFGRHSIVVYQGAQSPTTMSLADTVSGVGCIDRNTVQNTGTDVLFLSDAGLRSFGRTVQQKSLPLQNLSNNITKDLQATIDEEQAQTNPRFRTVYSPEFGFYLLTFVSRGMTYCFDVRGVVENGSFRVTRWPSTPFKSYGRTEGGDLLVGTTNGLGKYGGYRDNGESYLFRYYSPRLDFGDSSRTKILKKIKPTLIGQDASLIRLKWSYDFSNSYSTAQLSLTGSQAPSYYGLAEFGVSEFSSGLNISRLNANTTGYGNVVSIGLEADINGSEFSVQDINVLALLGKVL
jgi:hypothetical protein